MRPRRLVAVSVCAVLSPVPDGCSNLVRWSSRRRRCDYRLCSSLTHFHECEEILGDQFGVMVSYPGAEGDAFGRNRRGG